MGQRSEVQPTWLEPRRLAVDLLLAFYALFILVNYLGAHLLDALQAAR